VLTRSGFTTAIVGAVLIFAGRVFGLMQLFVLGLAAIAIVAVSALWLALRPRGVSIQRQVSSARLHAGDSSQVQVQVNNTNTMKSPVLRVTDDVAGTRGAELELPPLRHSESRVVGYRLPTERRGRVSVGPLRVHLEDPLSMLKSVKTAAGTVDVLVYPRIDQVAPPPRPPGDDARLADRQASQLGHSSNEFYALRQYVLGDDMRRVHWPSTARSDDLMVRQDELPQQGRTTILIDTRSPTVDDTAFEQMVSAAASLAVACRRRDDLVRLVSTDGLDTSFTPLAAHDPVLDYLATVQQSSAGAIDRTAALIAQGNPGSIVALVGADGASAMSSSLGKGKRNANATVIFGSKGAMPLTSGPALSSSLVMQVGAQDDFAQVWTAALGAYMTGRSPR